LIQTLVPGRIFPHTISAHLLSMHCRRACVSYTKPFVWHGRLHVHSAAAVYSSTAVYSSRHQLTAVHSSLHNSMQQDTTGVETIAPNMLLTVARLQVKPASRHHMALTWTQSGCMRPAAAHLYSSPARPVPRRQSSAASSSFSEAWGWVLDCSPSSGGGGSRPSLSRMPLFTHTMRLLHTNPHKSHYSTA
jgi:hypothetical protein